MQPYNDLNAGGQKRVCYGLPGVSLQWVQFTRSVMLQPGYITPGAGVLRSGCFVSDVRISLLEVPELDERKALFYG
jgi:hypothetical protein